MKQEENTSGPRINDPPYKPNLSDFSFQALYDPAKPHKNPRIEGWDTEDPNGDGKAEILANSREFRRIESFSDAMAFLTGRHSRGKRNFWWNIDYDVTALFKWNIDALKELTENGKVTFYRKDGSPLLECMYIPRKLLKLRRNDNTFYHYDMSQFYRAKLKDAAPRYLGRSPPDIKEDVDDLSDYNMYQIGDYCVWDATATKDLAQLYIDKLHNLKLYPKHFISNGNLAERLIRVHGDVPTWRDNPRYANFASWQSLRGAWVDCWKRGVTDVWKYDIKSAYPSVMCRLPDFRDGYWIDRYDSDLFVGFHLCRVKYQDHTPPCIASWGDPTLVYPDLNETTTCWLTNAELQRLEPYADIEIIDGTSFVPNNPEYSPWEELLRKLMKIKEEAKGDPGLYLATKALINSFYGKTVQKVETEDGWQAGRIFNPVAASMILAECRMQIFDAIKNHLDHVVMIATDCVATEKDLNINLGKELGDWELEAEEARSVFIRSGIYQVEDDRNHTRGFRFKGDFFNLLNQHTNSIKIRYQRPLTSRETLNWGRLGEANHWVNREYTLTLEDYRRLWLDPPETFFDLTRKRVESMAVPMTAIQYEGEKENDL